MVELMSAHVDAGVKRPAAAGTGGRPAHRRRMVVGAVESLVHRFRVVETPTGTERFEDELVAMLSGYLRGG